MRRRIIIIYLIIMYIHYVYIHNGQDCCNTQVIAEHFNTFFATIGAQNEAHIRTHQGSHFRDYLTRHTEARFAFHEIHNYETIRIIKNIKLSSSNGHDGISSELLKLISDDISKCITLIINQSLMSGIFPDKSSFLLFYYCIVLSCCTYVYSYVAYFCRFLYVNKSSFQKKKIS